MSSPSHRLIVSATEDFTNAPYSASLALGRQISEMETVDATYKCFPQELQDIAAFNTACGGLRSNGSRTSLRNLIVLDGPDFTRDFLSHAERGAKSLGFIPSVDGNPFGAELEWLDIVGDSAPTLLEDDSTPILLLDCVDTSFFAGMRLRDRSATVFLDTLPDPIAQSIVKANNDNSTGLDGHYARIHAYMMQHPNLEFVPEADYTRIVTDYAEGLKPTRSKGVWSKLRTRLQ